MIGARQDSFLKIVLNLDAMRDTKYEKGEENMSSKRNIFLVGFILVLFSTLAAFANDFSGSLTYSGEYNFANNKLNNSLSLDLNYIHSFTDEVFIEGDLVIKYTDKYSYLNPIMIIPKELYLGAYDLIPNLDLKTGLLIINWGASDMFSPLDNFNPLPPNISFTNSSRKNGVLGVEATYYFNDITYLQVIGLPHFSPPFCLKNMRNNYIFPCFLPSFKPKE